MLTDTLRGAGSASVRAALVTGLPGSGKSRLLHEARGRVPGTPGIVIVGHEPEQQVPLGAARDALRMLAESATTGTALADLAFGGATPVEGIAPLRLFEAAYRCAAEIAPAAMLVDDLQWADDLTVGLVSYFVRAAAADAIDLAVIVASRPGATAGAVAALFERVLPANERCEIDLAPLPLTDGVAMAQALAPTLSDAAAREVWRSAGGSPFWIEALATREAGGINLTRRLNQVTDDATSVLAAMAVIARPAADEELTGLLGWPARRSEGALRELQSRGLVTDRGGLLAFAHDLIREAAAEQLAEAQSRRLHARFSDQLRQEAAGDLGRLREALHHAVRGGRPVMPLAAELAANPQRRLLGSEGLGELGAIVDGADPMDPDRQRLDVLLAELAGELGDAAAERRRWESVAATHADRFVRARALVAAANAAYRLDDRDGAGTLIARARALQIDDEILQVDIDALESQILRWLDHRLQEARRLTDRAVERSRRLVKAQSSDELPIELRRAYLAALGAASDLELQEGNELAMTRIVEEILAHAGSEREQLQSRLLLASAYRRVGRMGDAEHLAREVLERARERIYPALMIEAGHHLGRALYNLGRLDEAEATAADTEQLALRLGETNRFLSTIKSLRPSIGVGRGDWPAAIERLRNDAASETDPHYRLGLQQEIATWLSRLGLPAAAGEVRDRVAAADADAAKVGCPRCQRELALKGAEALARIGAVEEARTRIAGAVEVARHSGEGRGYLGHALGLLASASGRHATAARILDRLCIRLERGGALREALWAELDLGDAVRHLDRERAIAAYRTVAARAEAGGVHTDLQVARQRLRDMGARVAPPRRDATGVLGLSRRELEVARLAASGSSNPEIAETLFLSRKTVERHMSAVLLKVGARNRTELATRIAALDDEPRK